MSAGNLVFILLLIIGVFAALFALRPKDPGPHARIEPGGSTPIRDSRERLASSQVTSSRSSPVDWQAVGRATMERQRAQEKAEVEKTLALFGDSVQRAFHCTLAGTSHRNSDRTSRTAAIKRCETGDILDLLPEPDNPYDKNALGVFLDGRQLGYVPRQIAAELEVGRRRYNERQLAIFCHADHHPDTDKVVGATVLIVRLIPTST